MPDTRYCSKCGEPCGWDDRFCMHCRAELRPSTPSPSARTPRSIGLDSAPTELGLQPGTVLLNRYRIESEIGEGGMGLVYLAHDEVREKPVAIKVLRNILSRDAGSVKRLLAEANFSMELSHPNVVRVHNFESGESQKFLVMEYVEGQTLANRLAEKGKFDEAEARRIAIEICKGVEHAHEKNVIHRDLKPGNILLGKDGSVKIADFGIARVCRDSLSRLTSHQTAGTLAYMSPEQLDGQTSERSDLYSIGVILYETLSGNPPFEGEPYVHKIKNVVPRPLAAVSSSLNEIVMRCLEKAPERRFASIRELREELDGSAERRRREEAERLREEKKKTQKVQELRGKGTEALSARKFAEAIVAWEAALALNPRDPLLADAISQARLKKLAAERAEADHKQAEAQEAERRRKEQEEHERQVNSLRRRAEDALSTGRFAEAIAAWEAALALNPGDSSLADAISQARRKMLLAERAEVGRKQAEVQETERRRKEQEEHERQLNSLKRRAEDTLKKSGANSLGMKFVAIEPGSFEMGSNSGDPDEKPVHRVTTSRGFQMQTTEVTQGQWEAVMGSNPSHIGHCGKNCPVERVSWDDAKAFIRGLTALDDGWEYRLPTEAEWEYAARAGTTGDYAGSLDSMAWYSANSGNKTHPVAKKRPSAWGLYDMHGNVWEWVEDWYGPYPSGEVTDPKGPSSGWRRVIRGGSWDYGAAGCRSAVRGDYTPDHTTIDLGFRLVRTAR